MRDKTLRISEPHKWRLIVRSAARNANPFNAPVRIALTFFGLRPRAGADNYCKCPIDGIVAAGLIRDDCYPYISELVLRTRPLAPGRRRPWTLVEIEEVG